MNFNKMNSIQIFILFCLEAYKNEKKITGKEVLSEFEKYNVFDFLSNFHDILHTQSMKYIIDEINEFIKNRK